MVHEGPIWPTDQQFPNTLVHGDVSLFQMEESHTSLLDQRRYECLFKQQFSTSLRSDFIQYQGNYGCILREWIIRNMRSFNNPELAKQFN